MIHKDIQDIRDLNYRDHRAYQTLRGLLWGSLYGPSVDTLHNGHEDLSMLAASSDLTSRQQTRMAFHRTEIDSLRNDCSKGNGACMVAAHHAQVSMAQQLSDIGEITSAQLEIDKSAREANIAKDVANNQAYARWMFDLREHINHRAEKKTRNRYDEHVAATMATYKNSHPQEFSP